MGESETTEESVAIVEGLYAMGAKAVMGVEIIVWESGENTGRLPIELPNDQFKRGELFAFEKNHAEKMGFDGEPDVGRPYLFMMLDGGGRPVHSSVTLVEVAE